MTDLARDAEIVRLILRISDCGDPEEMIRIMYAALAKARAEGLAEIQHAIACMQEGIPEQIPRSNSPLIGWIKNDGRHELARARAEEHARLLLVLEECDNDMGVYPAAIKGYHDERDYEQRDGFKNGWNACAMEFVSAVRKALSAEGPK